MEKAFKHIQAELKKYDIPAADFSDMQRTIAAGKSLLSGRRYQRVNVMGRIRSQITYISPAVWMAQFLLLLLCVYLMKDRSSGSDRQMLFSVASLFAASIALIGFPELCKSFSCGMWELEQACKYNLRQLMSLKMAIVGVADLICMALISVLCSGYSALPFWQVGIYLLVPFNLVCICGFLTVSFLRDKARPFAIWIAGGGAAAAVFLALSTRYAIYAVDFSVWIWGFVVSIAVSGVLIARFLKDLKQEVFTCN